MDKAAAAVASIGGVATATLMGGSYGPPRPRPTAWYAGLRKPSYTPPAPAIGLAWMGLDALMAFTGYRLLTRPPSAARAVALAAWGGSVAGLAGYPAVFFGHRRLGGGAFVALGMLGAAAATAAAARRVDRPAALASLPLVAWTGFASLLSEELWRRN